MRRRGSRVCDNETAVRLGTGGEDGMERRGEKGSCHCGADSIKKRITASWCGRVKMSAAMVPGSTHLKLDSRNVVVYPHVNNCIAKGKASFGPSRFETLPAMEASSSKPHCCSISYMRHVCKSSSASVLCCHILLVVTTVQCDRHLHWGSCAPSK